MQVVDTLGLFVIEGFEEVDVLACVVADSVLCLVEAVRSFSRCSVKGIDPINGGIAEIFREVCVEQISICN